MLLFQGLGKRRARVAKRVTREGEKKTNESQKLGLESFKNKGESELYSIKQRLRERRLRKVPCGHLFQVIDGKD